MYRTFGKRLFDVTVALAALIVLSPVMAAVALLVRASLGAPVLFRQERPGLYCMPFTLYKFRTMLDATDAHGRPLPDEVRLTAVGRFLRATSLDELPELVNILKGDMSLVGPRPLLMEYLELYTPEQMRRHDVKPGLSGWAQVSGRNALAWDERFARDVWYVDNMSWVLDLRIIAATALTVLRRQGISQPGHATAERFTGPTATEPTAGSRG